MSANLIIALNRKNAELETERDRFRDSFDLRTATMLHVSSILCNNDTGINWPDPRHTVVIDEARRVVARVAELVESNERENERVVCLLYILARDHLPFGTINDVIRNHVRGLSSCVYSSIGGEAMARAMAKELLGDLNVEESEA